MQMYSIRIRIRIRIRSESYTQYCYIQLVGTELEKRIGEKNCGRKVCGKPMLSHSTIKRDSLPQAACQLKAWVELSALDVCISSNISTILANKGSSISQLWYNPYVR